MDENNETSPPSTSSEEPKIVPESPKPLAFTVDFGEAKAVDSQRHKNLVEKLQKKHKRGQSLSKIEDPVGNTTKKHPLTGNLPRKSSFQSEGYFSSDEKSERTKNVRGLTSVKRSELSLPLKNVTSDKMSQSFPNAFMLFNTNTPEVELGDISSPELVLASPFSPKLPLEVTDLELTYINNKPRQFSSLECTQTQETDVVFVENTDLDFDKSDTVSDAGTYTLDADNYSEEQKARMSIDAEFKIEQVSVLQKTEDYIKSLCSHKQTTSEAQVVTQLVHDMNISEAPKLQQKFDKHKMLSPILSPTQNMSITQNDTDMNNGPSTANKTFTKIMFPSEKSRIGNGLEQLVDQGSVISVTSSGAFRSKPEKEKSCNRRLSLTKSEIQVEAYVDDKIVHAATKKLTANLINVQSISIRSGDDNTTAHSAADKVSNNLPPSGVCSFTGKMSPTKIPSPIHTLRPRSRSSLSSLNVDLSDSSLETESYLKPTQNCINSLQQRLSMDSDQDSDYDNNKYGLNNTPHNLLKQMRHMRHNSLDDKTMKISNKLEHFQNKNFQGIDQTFVFNQYNQQKVMHKIQNSPNNSPIRRSSSFSTKNHVKNTNLQHESNNLMKNSPSLGRNSSIQRSASTANIKPVTAIRHKIDRNQFGDTDTSSEEDFDKGLAKKKDLSGLTSTRYNRAFSLRRARLDEPAPVPVRCPNTPEMRRKFQPEYVRAERAISVDRKPVRTNEVQSRYLQSVGKKVPVAKVEPLKLVAKVASAASKSTPPGKPQIFSRTDSGRFSVRASGKPPSSGGQKAGKKDGSGKKSSGRSNSSLSSKEKEFQNWKRRKSYDPMKAAAEGKRKEIAKKQNVMTQSFTEANYLQDCDSSPSHSSSVHRSQL